MANIFYNTYQLIIDAFGSAAARLKDSSGNDLSLAIGGKQASSQGSLLAGGLNESWSTPIRTDRLGNIITGNAQIQLADNFASTIVNLTKWAQSTTTFTQAQTVAGGLNLNSGASTTAGAYSILTSAKKFVKLPRVPLQIKSRVRLSMVANSIFEVGFGAPTTTTAIISDGAFWRISGTNATPYISNGNTEQPGGTNVDLSTLMAAASYLIFDTVVLDDTVIFTIEDAQNQVLYRQTVNVQNAWVKIWQVGHQSAFYRLYQSVSPASSPTAIVTEMSVLQHDIQLMRTPGEISALLSLCGDQVPDNVTLNTNFANSTIPASATLSNTAAGYTTLGGQWQFAAVAGAETDYCLFGYQVPAGYTMFVDAIRIEAFNMGAAVATTPTLLQWGVAHDSSAVSLATANQLKRTLGTMGIAIGGAIGQRFDNTIDTRFTTPIKTEGGRFFCVIVKCPVGTATASQIIRGTVSIDARFE